MLLKLLIIFLHFSACATNTQIEEIKHVEDVHLRLSLLSENFGRYRLDGPFSVVEKRDTSITLTADDAWNVDLYKTSAAGKAPIILISHGNFSGKRAHRQQAQRLASWGFHVVVLELPNRNEWLLNGQRVFELTNFLKRWPKFLGNNVDADRIILVGHSLGGSVMTLAAAQGAPHIGVILLDPAVVHPSVTKAMEQIQSPGVLLGSDAKIFAARGRSSFRKHWGGEFAEISVNGATHDDAQGPSMFSDYTLLGIDPFTDSSQRDVFKASLVAAAMSIANAGNLEQFMRDLKPAQRLGSVQAVTFRRY